MGSAAVALRARAGFWMAEIRLPADRRIGELIRDLEKAQGARKLPATGGKKSKEQAIRDAGLSVRTAARYEEIAGPREARAAQAPTAAADQTTYASLSTAPAAVE